MIISFDYDWTIAYASPLTTKVFHNVLQEEGFDIPLREIKKAFVKLETSVSNKYSKIKKTVNLLSHVEADLFIIAYYIERLKLLEPFSISNTPSTQQLDTLEKLGEQIFKTGRKIQQTKFYDDVRPCLEQLSQSDIQTVIISSNTYKQISKYLKLYNVENYFNDIFTPDTLNMDKEDIYKHLSELTGEFNSIFHIGDDFESDGIAPLKCGIKPVIIIRPNHYLTGKTAFDDTHQFPIVQSFQEFESWLKKQNILS